MVVPLGAVLFAQAGRHPIAGLAAGFAGVSGGFSANLLVTSVDALLAGLTSEAAQLFDPGYEVTAPALRQLGLRRPDTLRSGCNRG